MGENHFAGAPTALYGVVLLMNAVAYWILQHVICASQGPESLLKKAVQGDWKGNLSPAIYVVGDPGGDDRAVARRRPVCRGRGHLAGARPPHRAGPDAVGRADRGALAPSGRRHRHRQRHVHRGHGIDDAPAEQRVGRARL